MTRRWLDAEQAVYLRSDRLMTPMGTGVGAYATREAALEAQQAHGGTVLELGDFR